MFTNTLILSTVIFCISLVLCYIPSKIKSVKVLKTVYPYITIAAAGFMLAMLLMDFIPHVTGSCMHKSHQKNKHHSLDECPNALVCEIHKKDASKHKHSHDSSCEDHSHHDHSHHDHKHEFSFFMKNLGFFMAGLSFIFLLGIDSLLLQHSHCNNEEIVYMNDGINHGAHQHQYCHVHEEMHSSSSIGDMHPNHHSDGSIVIEKSAEIQTSQPCSAPLKKNNEEVTIDENNSNEKDQKKETKIHFHSEQKETFYLEGGCNTSALKDQKGRLQAMIFIIALSIHSLFEGFAIKSTDIGIFEIGLILHKALESFALGFTVCMANFSTQFKLILMTTYSLLTPLGMFISFLLQKLPIAKKSAKIGHIFQSTCNGLALGSILFIVCVEMIPPNFHSKGANLYKIFTLIAGYLSTCIIIYFIH